MFQLDQLLQEESGTLQSLQRDKEDIERALGGLRVQLQNGEETPIALEAARRQQHTLERELSRIYQLLAENSKVVEVPSRLMVFISLSINFIYKLLKRYHLLTTEKIFIQKKMIIH